MSQVFMSQVFMFGTINPKPWQMWVVPNINSLTSHTLSQAKLRSMIQSICTTTQLFVHLLSLVERLTVCTHTSKGEAVSALKRHLMFAWNLPEALKSRNSLDMLPDLVHSYTSALRATGLSNLFCQGFFSIMHAVQVELRAAWKDSESLLRGIKDWVSGFWGYIMAKFGSPLWQEKKLDIIVYCCYV